MDAETIKVLGRSKPQRHLLLNPDIFPEQLAEVSSALAIFGKFAPSNVQNSWKRSKQAVFIPCEGDNLTKWPTVVAENRGKQ